MDDATAVEVGTTKVAFCCEKCQAKFNEADDAGKLKVVFDDLDKGFTRQVKCPVSGKPINPEGVRRIPRQEGLLLLPRLPGRVSSRT